MALYVVIGPTKKGGFARLSPQNRKPDKENGAGKTIAFMQPPVPFNLKWLWPSRP